MKILTVLTNVTNVEAGAIAAVISALMGMFVFFAVISLIVWAVSLVAKWMQFNKAGEPGWKAIIPIYNDYMEAKLYWDTTIFWVVFVIIVVLAFISGLFKSSNTQLSQILQSIASILGLVFNMILAWFQCKSFGKSTGFAILHMIPGVSVITNFIIACDSSQYLGNTTKQ